MAAFAYLFLAILAAASAAPETRIVGGTPTTIEDFPYVVAYTYTYPNIGVTVQRCVGSLVSSWHVLTTSFCFTGANLLNMKVRAGSTYSMSGGKLVDIQYVAKHSDYVEKPRAGDVAVTFLERPLGISDTINVLFLPPTNFYIPDGQSVKVVSWGFESEEDREPLNTLKTVYLEKMGLEECQGIYDGEDDPAITDRVICASAPGKGMCTGDSGAPMVIDNVVVGISSNFKDCQGDDYPDVFSRVDRYTDWVLRVTAAGPPSGSNIRSAPTSL